MTILSRREVNCCSSACLSQKIPEETFAVDSLMECNTIEQGCGEKSPLEVTKENGLTDTSAKVRQIKDAFLSLERKELKQTYELAIELWMCKESEKLKNLDKQADKSDPEPLGNVGGIKKLVVEEEGHTASQPENLPAELREDRLEKADLSCVEGHIQMSASCSCLCMEMDIVEYSIA